MDIANTGDGGDSQNISAKGAAVLVVIGEPFSEEHKKLILGDITKGFRSWDCEATGLDINDELAQCANRADLGQEGPNGERVIRHQSDSLAMEILVNPQIQTVTLAVNNFLATPTKHKQMIYAGHAFQGNGAWILQDDTYTFHNFTHAFKDTDVDNSVKQQGGTTLNIYTSAEGDWSNGHISKTEFSKLLDVKLNPAEKLDMVHGVLQFTAYVSNFVKVKELNELLPSSDVVGNIKFTRPTLYIFPSCQGDSALFGISGFNLLVNGGYSRKACFWDFTRHLDRIDAALMTHLGADNLYGFKSVLQRKSVETIHPDIGFMYVNASDKLKPLEDSDNVEKEPSLKVNLAEEGNRLVQYAKQMGQAPHPCSRSVTGSSIEPLNLYHKVGIGSLDMYILNPITDSKELKDFYQQWNQNVAQFGTAQHLPLPNTLSICALLVWRPSNPNDNITRIFFPGNAPQHKVLEGLEKLKSLDILKHPSCTKASLSAKPAKKPSGLSAKPPARSKASPVNTPRTEVKKESTPVEKKETKAPPKPKPSVPKAKKEDTNKKTMKTPERPISTKTDKPVKSTPPPKPSTPKSAPKTGPIKTSTPNKSAASSKSSTPSKGSAKGSAASTPKGSASPVKGPASTPKATEPEPPKAPSLQPEPVQTAAAADLVDLTPPPEQPPVFNGGDASPATEAPAPELVEIPAPCSLPREEPLFDVQPEAIPEPAVPELQAPPQQMDKEKMLELGIYDEDQDIDDGLSTEQSESTDTSTQPPQMFGGMTDSMHQDLVGDFGMAPNAAMQGSFHGDLMSGSMHESMFGSKQPFDGPLIENGGTNVDELMTPDDDTSEEVQPQALPEPVAYTPESYGQEPDIIPTIAGKEEALTVAETDATSLTPQEPDVLPVKQDQIDDDITLPVEDKHSAVETPDEVENNFPEDEKVDDIQEKDMNEDLEKHVEPFSFSERVPEIETDELESKPQNIEPAVEEFEKQEMIQEEGSSVDPIESAVNGEKQMVDNVDEQDMPLDFKQDSAGAHFDSNEPAIDSEKELIDDDDDDEQDIHLDSKPDVSNAPINPFDSANEVEREPIDDVAEQDILLDSKQDQPEVPVEQEPSVSPHEIERPSTPEPLQMEQDLLEQKSNEPEPYEELQQPMAPTNIPTPDENLIENDVTPSEETSTESESQVDPCLEAEDIVQKEEKPHLEETVARDSMERDVHSMERDERDSIEFSDEAEQRASSEEIQRDSMERDSAERDMGNNEQRSSSERESDGQPEDEQKPVKNLVPEDQRESAERSFEDDSEETEETDDDEEDEDEDSSSFEQEDNTDEKCLINPSADSSEVKDVMGEQTAPSQQPVTDQPSETFATPDSEMTDPSHGGQLGYHQVGEQDDDSGEDIDDVPAANQAFDPFAGNFGAQPGMQSYGQMKRNPFESMEERPATNPFAAYNEPIQKVDDSDEDDVKAPGGPMSFDPLAEWGEPMGLPSPAAVDDKAKKPGLTTKKPAPSNGVPEKSKSKTGASNLNTSRSSTNPGRLSIGSKGRPASAPAKEKSADDIKYKANGTRRPATASGNKSASTAAKAHPLPPFNPFYVDLTYIPNHGNSSYSDVEFFKRVRARYYVLSALSPNTHVLDALLEGKNTWEDKSLPVTVIPTYDNETLRLWMSLHKEKLANAKVDIAPSASRCTIQLQDHETSSSAFRLEF